MSNFRLRDPQDVLEKFKKYVTYDPKTGVFKRIKMSGRNSGGKIGEPTGYISDAGYLKISIYKEVYSGHQLAWLFTYGEWGLPLIDHKDGNKLNNKITNLRKCCQRANQLNRSMHRKGKLAGVRRNVRSWRWRAQIKIGGKTLTIGSFDTAEEAHKAYLKKFKEVDPEGFKLYSRQK